MLCPASLDRPLFHTCQDYRIYVVVAGADCTHGFAPYWNEAFIRENTDGARTARGPGRTILRRAGRAGAGAGLGGGRGPSGSPACAI